MIFTLRDAVLGAVRSFARHPRFAIGATMLLGLSLLALATVVSLFEAVVLQPLPFAKSDQLLAIHATVQREGVERRELSRADFVDYQAQIPALSSMAGWSALTVTLVESGPATVTGAEVIDADYFEVLGVEAAIGSGLVAHSQIAISDRLWRQQFSSDSAALGRSISLDGRPYVISGVMPAGFGGISGMADIWLSFDAPGLISAGRIDNRGSRWHEAVARLAPGMALPTVNEQFAQVGLRLAESYPGSNTGYSARAVPLHSEVLGQQGEVIFAVATGVAMLLLVTVLNMAGLALVRANSRTAEFAMRRCLGASANQLLVTTVAEGALIGLVAGAIACLVASALLPSVFVWLPIALPSYVSVAMTPTVVMAVLAAGALGGGGAFTIGGLVARRADLSSLRAGARATKAHGGLRRLLVGGEIAAGVALLALALLLTRSFVAIDQIQPGYAVAKVAVLEFELPEERYSAQASYAFGLQLERLAEQTPGVVAATLSSDSPLSEQSSATLLTSDQLESAATRVYRHIVAADFFAVSGIALQAGTSFSPDLAADAPRQVVISARLAEQMWPGQSALGRKLKVGPARSGRPWMEVVGIAQPVRWRGLPSAPTADPDYYEAMVQSPRMGYSLILSTAGNARQVAASVEENLRSLDPNVPVYALHTMAERVFRATLIPRFLAALGMCFALIALLLATLGIFAIAALDAGQRIRELAIRRAVGAGSLAMARLFLVGYGQIFVVAAALGLVLVLPLTAYLGETLYAVGSADPMSLLAAIGIFGIALLAGLVLPLRTVLSVQPAQLVRND